MIAKRLIRDLLGAESRAITIALALLLIALLVPALKIPRDTYSYLVFFDISQSMNVEDYEIDGRPASRLAYARHAVRDALRELPCGSRIGLGAFVEYRTLMLVAPIEVCDNYHDLLVSLDYIDGSMRWRESSEITKGVFWSIRAAKELGKNSDVLFLTDGQESPPLRPGAHPHFDDIEPGEVRGWLIGVGGYTPLPIPRTDRMGNRMGYWRADDVVQRRNNSGESSRDQGNEHLSSLRESHLQSLAQQVGFDYARLERPSSIRRAMQDRRFSRRTLVPTDLYWLPAMAALILLVLRFRPSHRLKLHPLNLQSLKWRRAR
jgi:mxaL protein